MFYSNGAGSILQRNLQAVSIAEKKVAIQMIGSRIGFLMGEFCCARLFFIWDITYRGFERSSGIFAIRTFMYHSDVSSTKNCVNFR